MASLPFTAPQFSHFKSTKAVKCLNSNEPIHLIEIKRSSSRNHQTLYNTYFHTISSLCKDGQIQQAVDLLVEMDSKNLPVGPEIYGEILQGCVYERDLFTGQQVHSQVLKKGALFARNEYIETKLVIFNAKCGAFDVANNLFSRLRVKNVFSWASIIGLKCRIGLNEEALMGLSEMLEDGFLPDNFVVPNALKACGALQWLGFGKGIHGYVVKVGFDGCVFVANSLICMGSVVSWRMQGKFLIR